MYDDYQISTRPMTADDAFAILVALMREAAVGYGDATINALSFDTSIFEWELAFIGAGDVAIPRGFNAIFGTSLSADAWKAVLEPPRQRTLGDVCRLVAQHAAVTPVIEPITVMGDRSHAAGAFLAVRRILQDEGVDVSQLRPSSLLAPYLLEKWQHVLPRLRQLAPQRLPPATIAAPAQLACAHAVVASGGLLLLGLKCGSLRMALAGVVCLIGFCITVMMLRRFGAPVEIRIGATKTFRDLSQVLVGERVAWPGFPVSTR